MSLASELVIKGVLPNGQNGIQVNENAKSLLIDNLQLAK